MRRVLPGGAVLGGTNRDGTERPVACRSLSAVVKRTRSQSPAAFEPAVIVPTAATVEPVAEPPRTDLPKRLAAAKLALEVLAVFVGLVGAVLALFGVARQ